MERFIVVVVVSAVMLLLAVVGATSKSSEERWSEHKRRVDRRKCGVPPEVVVKATEVIGDSVEEVEYSPHQTLLHRCKQSGCCLKGFCSPKNMETVNLVFKATRRISGNQLRSNFIEILAENHTQCECR